MEEEKQATPTTSQNNRRIAKNTMMLYFRMILTMIVSLYTSRVVLNTLGVVDYGVYNVVGGIVSLFGFFNSAMSSATQRFLSFEIGRGDFVQLRKTFNAAQIIHIGIALLIFILAETIGLWFVKKYLVIPAERMEAAIWVYHYAVLSFMITIIQVPYNATIIARERMNVYAYVSILEVSLKLLIVFMLTWITYDKLKLYAILHFGVVVIIASIYRIYTRVKFQEVRFQIIKDKKLYKTLVSYSGWNLFGQMGAMARGQGVNILLNLFFGPVINAAQAVANQINGAIQSFVSNFQMASNPQIVKTFASNEKDYMIRLVFQTAKFSFYLLLILTLPVLLEVDIILKLWLKIVPDYASTFTVIILVIALVESISGPLITAIHATGNIKAYQIIIGGLLFLILPVSYLFLNKGYPPQTPLYITLVQVLIALCVRLFIVKRQIDFPVMRFVNEIVLKNLFLLLIVFIPLFLFRSLLDQGIIRLVIITLSAVGLSIVIVYFLGMNKNERHFVKRMIFKALGSHK